MVRVMAARLVRVQASDRRRVDVCERCVCSTRAQGLGIDCALCVCVCLVRQLSGELEVERRRDRRRVRAHHMMAG